MIRVSAPTRLHFGLLHVPADGSRRFGGLGAMLASPRVEVAARAADQWSTHGTLAERARRFVDTIIAQTATAPHTIQADGPPEHTGLGIGTALGLSIACALGVSLQLADRGERSKIGVHGFEHGGFLLDHGDRAERLPFPPGWSFALLSPRAHHPWHGDRERAAFARCRSVEMAHETTARLHDLIENRLKPALDDRNFAHFAAALGDYNRIAGEPFATDQGGAYASPEATAIIEKLKTAGFAGVGQSSWGPTLFAAIDTPTAVDKLRDTLSSAAVTVTTAKVTETGVLRAVLRD